MDTMVHHAWKMNVCPWFFKNVEAQLNHSWEVPRNSLFLLVVNAPLSKWGYTSNTSSLLFQALCAQTSLCDRDTIIIY